MPGYNQTGPAGYGPGTGRGMGPCGRGMAYRSGFLPGYGRGFFRGQGFGPGFYGNYSEPEPLSKEAQKQLLEAELRRLEAEKAEIERRLTSIE